MNLRWMLVAAFLMAAHSAHGQPVKIMALGDSWTSGYGEYVSYRYDLWSELKTGGFDVDFVGGNTETDGEPNTDWYPDFETAFDREHEGYSGWTTTRLLDVAGAAAATHRPDVVLLWAGTNDIWIQGSRGAARAPAGIRDMIEDIRSAVPGVTVLLALNPPYQGPNANLVVALNESIANIAAQLDQPQSPVILVDHYTDYLIEEMTWDGVHQNRVGEAWIAANWLEVLELILPEPEPFGINAGHSGAWFNPGTSGQGLLLDVDPQNRFAFLSWFTYTDSASGDPGQQHWFTAQGAYSGNAATLPLYESLGGRFDDSAPVETVPIGELVLEFEDCERGTVTYAIESWDLQGAFPIERVIPGSGNVCQQHLDGNPGEADPDSGVDGGWYDPTTTGQGLLLDVHSDGSAEDFLFAAWFTYGDDTRSGQRWLTAQGSFDGSQGAIEVYESSGGLFDHPQAPATVPVGTMTVDFADCNNGTLDYSLTADGLDGSIDLTRLLPKGDSLCEAPAQAE